jgi:hypothetical protein
MLRFIGTGSGLKGPDTRDVRNSHSDNVGFVPGLVTLVPFSGNSDKVFQPVYPWNLIPTTDY